MRIGRFEHGGKHVYGLVEGDTVYALEGSIFEEPQKGRALGPFSELKVRVPCQPTKILGIGRNYPRSDVEILPEDPQIFLKPLTTLVSNNNRIVRPWMSEWVIYEPELAVVIGKVAQV